MVPLRELYYAAPFPDATDSAAPKRTLTERHDMCQSLEKKQVGLSF
ncbi:hypothetical protein [Massilia sp. TSP1-1-2]